MKTFTESDRYSYPELSPNSIVLDVGGYEGNWSKTMREKYGCLIVCFEPIKSFFDKIQKVDGVIYVNKGVGAFSGEDIFHIQNDSSGKFAQSGNTEPVSIMGIEEVLKGFPDRNIDLIKMNVENMEYDIMDAILDKEIQNRFLNFQIQFHRGIPDFEKRYRSINSRILKTHDATYCEPFCWENYKLKI